MSLRVSMLLGPPRVDIGEWSEISPPTPPPRDTGGAWPGVFDDEAAWLCRGLASAEADRGHRVTVWGHVADGEAGGVRYRHVDQRGVDRGRADVRIGLGLVPAGWWLDGARVENRSA